MEAGKIAAFYREFPFLEAVAPRFLVGGITVNRITRELAAQTGKFFLFNHSGYLLGRSRFWETLEDAFLRVGGQSRVAFVVKKEAPNTSNPYMYIPKWLGFIGGGYTITVYKPPKDFKMEDLQNERAILIAQEVREEIDNA
jgi:hypothetical protein